MDSKTFNNVIEAQLERSTSTLVKKAAEYATSDRLHNFKVAADLQRVSTKVALAGMMAKHTVSVYDMMHSDEMFSEDMWNEKITDHINYLLLLQGIVTAERMEATTDTNIEELRKKFSEGTMSGNAVREAVFGSGVDDEFPVVG